MIRAWGIEFGPPLVFVISYRLSDFYTATSWLIAVTVIGLALGYAKERRVALFPLLFGLTVLVFASLTLTFTDPRFLMAQDTLAGGLFAAAIMWSQHKGRPILKRLFDPLFALSDRGWAILSLRWGGYFSCYAVANELVRNLYSEAQWVTYKTCIIGVTALFGCYQLTVSRRERLPGESTDWGLRLRPADSELGSAVAELEETGS